MHDFSWHEARRRGIGGSDVAPILGFSPWRTPLEVYLEKIGEAPPSEESTAMLIGTALEPWMRAEYVRLTGEAVTVPGKLIVHPQYPFILANLDGLAGGRVVEFKTAARRGEEWGAPGSDEIPPHYLTQVLHYLEVTGLPVADVGVLFKDDPRPALTLYRVEANREIQSELVERERRFWEGHVLPRIPPRR